MIFPERVFGRLSAKRMSSGLRDRAELLAHPVAQFFVSASASSPAGRSPRHTTYANTDSPLIVVRLADHRGLGDPRMRHQRRFDLHRAEPMAGDVQHVVDAAHDPEVAVLVAVRAVAGDVDSGSGMSPSTC